MSGAVLTFNGEPVSVTLNGEELTFDKEGNTVRFDAKERGRLDVSFRI